MKKTILSALFAFFVGLGVVSAAPAQASDLWISNLTGYSHPTSKGWLLPYSSAYFPYNSTWTVMAHRVCQWHTPYSYTRTSYGPISYYLTKSVVIEKCWTY